MRCLCHYHNHIFIVSSVEFSFVWVNAFVKCLICILYVCVCACGHARRRGWPSEKSYSSVADASHLIGKHGEPITANRSTPQAARLFFGNLDDESNEEALKEKEEKIKKRKKSEIKKERSRERLNVWSKR